MLLEALLKKAVKDSAKLVAKKPDEDFIPYVCHFDPTTILTKNGELLKTIRITGFNSDAPSSEIISLREAVRDAIAENVKENKFAFWFNTIRRKKNLVPKGEFKDYFPKYVNDIWVKKNDWNDQYVNELYVTIIIEGLDSSIINVESFFRSFSYFTTRNMHREALEKAHVKLTKTVNNVLSSISEYGAKLLGIKEWDGVLYSEPMRFFGKIVNLYEERYPLSANDISNDLASHKVAFGNRELEVVGYNNKNYAAMLSLKEYSEVSINSLDRILQLPCEFIITQSFDFAFTKKELEPFEYQNYILQVSGDEEFRQLSGISNFIENRANPATDYGKLQTTIMFISKNLEQMEKDIKEALAQFNSLGFVVIREDIFSEHCFWSQLPGNFRYLARQKLINSSRLAGFAALHNFPIGSFMGNQWGSAITVFKTVLNTPYFFNFHEKDLGHSLILGPEDSKKIMLLNFLIAQSRKNEVKVFYLDLNNEAYSFTQALQGKVYNLEVENNHKEFLKLNPFLLGNTPENRSFLISFFTGLLSINAELSQSDIDLIPATIDRIFASNCNNFTSAIEAFNMPETKNIYSQLQVWNSPELNKIFNSPDEINWDDQFITIDLSQVFSEKTILVPIVDYLLYKAENALKGAPSIIILSEAWDLLDNKVMAPKVNDFLKRAKEKNCVVIFVSQNFGLIASSELSMQIKDNFNVKIFMPNENKEECYSKVFGLNEEENNILHMMSQEDGYFLLKQSTDSVIVSLDLRENVEIVKILQADEMTLEATKEVINIASEEGKIEVTPDVWLPQLFDVLKEIEKEEIAERKKIAREERAKDLKLKAERD